MNIQVINTLKDCDGPPEVQDPVHVYCLYEYAKFVDCSMGAVTQSATRLMAREAYGSISTYLGGGDGTPNGNMPVNKVFSNWSGQPAGGTVIEGVPQSKTYFVGCASIGWTNFFINQGKNYIGRWWVADKHNHFPFKHRIHHAKYLKLVVRVMRRDQLVDADGNFIWTCPTSDPGGVPDMANTEWGPICPPYYKLVGCVDCIGNQQELDTQYWEMKDFKNITAAGPGGISKPIIEFPRGSKQCYQWEKMAGGAKTDDDINIKNFIKVKTQESDYDSMESCQDCHEDYYLAIAPVTSLDIAPVGFYDPEMIGTILGVENQLNVGIMNGYMSIKKMLKGDAANDAFYNQYAKTFFYKGGDGKCYKASFLTDQDQKDSYGNCIPAAIFNWAAMGGIIHSSNFTNVTFYSDYCDCSKDGGNIGNKNAYKQCFPPDPAPIITQHPVDFNGEVDRVNTTITATFTVAATGNNLRYEWYRSNRAVGAQGQTGPIAIGSNSPTLTLTVNENDNHDPANPSSFNQVWCVVSNNNGATFATSNQASIFVVKRPVVLWPGRKVYLGTVDVYCLEPSDMQNMKNSGIYTSLDLPENHAQSCGVQRVYWNPDDYDVYDSSLRTSDLEGKYFIRVGATNCCGGVTKFTVLKTRDVTEEDWEDDVPVSLKGVDANGDENYRAKYVLGKGSTSCGDANSVTCTARGPFPLDNISARDWGGGFRGLKNTLRLFGLLNI